MKSYKKNIPLSWQIIISSSGLKALSYKALNAMNIPERKTLLSPWLLQASVNMVFADRGIGKTYFCLSCAIALAEGSSFIHYNALKPVKVLYMDGEMQAILIRERIKSLIKNETLVNDNLFILTPDCQDDRNMPDLSEAQGLDEVDDIIKQINPDVIFVDNLSTFIRSGRENEGESWLPVQEWAIRQRSAGRAVIAVHHTNKEGSQRGSSRKEDTMDIIMQLKRPDDDIGEDEGACFEIGFTKHRYIYGKDVQPVEVNLKDNKWSWKNAETNYTRTIELLKSGHSQKEIAEELEVNKSNVSRWKDKALSEGLLTA